MVESDVHGNKLCTILSQLGKEFHASYKGQSSPWPLQPISLSFPWSCLDHSQGSEHHWSPFLDMAISSLMEWLAEHGGGKSWPEFRQRLVHHHRKRTSVACGAWWVVRPAGKREGGWLAVAAIWSFCMMHEASISSHKQANEHNFEFVFNNEFYYAFKISCGLTKVWQQLIDTMKTIFSRMKLSFISDLLLI